MNPGLSPIFLDPSTGHPTNVPPPGNIPFAPGPPRWELNAFPDQDPVPISLRNQGNP